jgi:hypothetical protein
MSPEVGPPTIRAVAQSGVFFGAVMIRTAILVDGGFYRNMNSQDFAHKQNLLRQYQLDLRSWMFPKVSDISFVTKSMISSLVCTTLETPDDIDSLGFLFCI